VRYNDGVRREDLMELSLRPPRTPSILSHSVRHQLNGYALAASAAGVGMLALAQPAEAKIVYHKTHLVIAGAERYNLDLNGDKITDFSVVNFFTTTCPDSCVQVLYLKPAAGNSEVGSAGKYVHYAAAMKKGSVIGPKAHFLAGSAVMREAFSTQTSIGPWDNVKNRYLGLKFQIKGKAHYGWARLNETGSGLGELVATMTGYAYETTANKAIVAGDTTGTEDPVDQQGTLGDLALGMR
jgi:hypothetical protein